MTENDMKAYVAYLEEKGLVVTEQRPANILLIRVAARGLDALDARIEVRGVGQDMD